MNRSRFRVAAALLYTTLVAANAPAQTTSVNAGSLGAVANGTNSADAILNVPGPLAASGDVAVQYANGAQTTIPYLAAINPAVSQPFSIEFWAKPTAYDTDDAPVANRIAAGNRSGWVFFQRDAATGWNFRMYNGNMSALGWDLTGGTANLNAWSHVVATWNGSAAQLYVNGLLADNSNAAGLNGVYNVTTAATFSIGALQDRASASTASIDEVAFYGSALTLAQISNHYTNGILTPVPGAYRNLVINDGALVYLPNTQSFSPGDIDQNGSVTRGDVAQFVNHFGRATGSVWTTGDFNSDGVTSLADLALLQTNYSPSGSASAVPEPASWLMIVSAIGIVAVRSRNRCRNELSTVH